MILSVVDFGRLIEALRLSIRRYCSLEGIFGLDWSFVLIPFWFAIESRLLVSYVPKTFVIATDVLAAMFAMADRLGALRTSRFLQAKNRLSLYADDLVIFTEPDLGELNSVKKLMQCFGEASGLLTNFAKSSIIPIHCSQLDTNALAAILTCPIQSFPCTYLGLPLSDQRLRNSLCWFVFDC